MRRRKDVSTHLSLLFLIKVCRSSTYRNYAMMAQNIDEREAEESPIDIVGGAESRSFDREIFYDGTAGDFPEDESRMSTKRRPKKKKQIVYSDNDDFDIPDSGMIQHDDQDDDFLPEPLPRSSKSKAKAKSAISKTKRSPKAKDVIATSRVLSTVVVSADTEDAEASRKASERGSGDISSQRPVALVEKESEEVVATESVTPKKKKLPTIKKNKTLVTPSSSTNITSGPASSAVAVVSEPASREVVSGRKPAATAGNADLDLTNTDIYNSLFKSVSDIHNNIHAISLKSPQTGTTPRSGLNRR